MFYKLLGMVVWNAAKLFLRRKLGRPYAPKPLVAGAIVAGVVAGVVAVAILASRRDAS